MPTETAASVEPMFLPEVEANPQPSPYLNLIERARNEGKENWQIWNLFAFRPEMNLHMGRFTHAVMHEAGPIPPALRELIATYTSSLNDCEFCMRSHAAVTSHLIDEATVAAVLEDIETSPIPESEKALLRFTRKVTQQSSHIRAEDMKPSRGHYTKRQKSYAKESDHSFEAAKGRSGLKEPFRSRPVACQV